MVAGKVWQRVATLALIASNAFSAQAAQPQDMPPAEPATPAASAPHVYATPHFALPLTPEEAAALQERHRANDTAQIRLHHTNHFNTRLTTAPEVLQATCRYESSISTVPPKGHVALTFDDGPEPGQTEHIIDVLRRYQVPATFFMIGDQVRRYPELVRLVMENGHHLVANHSWDHPNFHSITATEQAQEVEKTQQELRADMHVKYFRYPYGNSTCETNALLHEQGYQIVGWHIDSCDWAFDKDGKVDAKDAVMCGVLAQYRADYVGHVLSAMRAHNGGILLMHEIHPNTLQKLEEIIRTALADGFVFDTIDSPAFQSSMR